MPRRSSAAVNRTRRARASGPWGSTVDVQAPASIRRPPASAARLPLVTDWPEGWRPANLAEAQEYVDAHAGGGGDAETLEHCNWVFERSTKPPRPQTPETETRQD